MSSLAVFILCCAQALAGAPPAAVLDTSFGEGGLVKLPSELLGWEANGEPTVGGGILASGGAASWLLSGSGGAIEPFDGEGTLGPSAPGSGDFTFADMTLDSAGRLLVVGTVRSPKEPADEAPIVPSTVRILRFLPDGRLDSGFGQNGVLETGFGLPPPRDKQGQPLQPETSMRATGIAVDAQGRIVVTGGADIELGQSCVHDIFQPVPVSAAFVARLTENGTLDPSFGRGGVVGGRSLGETPLHAATFGKPLTSPSGGVTLRSTDISACPSKHGRWGVAQLTADGGIRNGLGRKGAVGGYFTALAAEPDGSVIALARMGWTQGEAFRARIIRISPKGKVDRSFGRKGWAIVKLGSPYGNEPDSLAVDGQGRILLGGTLVTSKRERTSSGKLKRRGQRSILLVRLTSSGHQEMSFGPNGRVATSFPTLQRPGPSDLFFDNEGRLVTVHRYEASEGSGLVFARYLLRNSAASLSPYVRTGFPFGVGEFGAALVGWVNARGAETTASFQLGRTKSYGRWFPPGEPEHFYYGYHPSEVETGVTKLRPGTTYHFRLVAKSAGGVTYGRDKTFRTLRRGD